MAPVGYCLRSRAPAVENKPVLSVPTYTWDITNNQIRSSFPGSRLSCVYQDGHSFCAFNRLQMELIIHWYLPDLPSLLLHLMLYSQSWVVAKTTRSLIQAQNLEVIFDSFSATHPISLPNILVNPKSTYFPDPSFPLLSHCHDHDLIFHHFLQELLTHYRPCHLLVPQVPSSYSVTEVTFLEDQSNYTIFITKFCQWLPLTFSIQSQLLNQAYRSPAYLASVPLMASLCSDACKILCYTVPSTSVPFQMLFSFDGKQWLTPGQPLGLCAGMTCFWKPPLYLAKCPMLPPCSQTPPCRPSFVFHYVIFTCLCLSPFTLLPNQAQCLEIRYSHLFGPVLRT